MIIGDVASKIASTLSADKGWGVWGFPSLFSQGLNHIMSMHGELCYRSSHGMELHTITLHHVYFIKLQILS